MPAGHGVQVVAFVAAYVLPAAHVRHALAPAADAVPAAQGIGAFTLAGQ